MGELTHVPKTCSMRSLVKLRQPNSTPIQQLQLPPSTVTGCPRASNQPPLGSLTLTHL